MIALQSASQQLGGMELLEEELTCPICCCIFEDPRVLLCSHSFCKKCLEGLLEGNRGLRTPFKCPTCRKETPHNGANSLQINYSLRGIVEKYSRIRVLPRMSICKQHCAQPLNIFCATDQMLICGFCATTDAHKGHKFSSLEDAYVREKEAFEGLLRGVESWKSADIQTCLETLQASKKRALRAVSLDAEKVSDYFDKLIGALECKKNEVLSDFETMRLEVMQTYDPGITRLSAALEEQRQALSIAESFRSVTDPLCFLQHMQEFREKQRLLRETPLPSRRDVDVAPPLCDFDVHRWDSLKLSDVDKIALPPHEAGSGQARRRGAVARFALAALWMCVLGLWCAFTAPSLEKILALVDALGSRALDAGLYLQERVCTGLIGAEEECVVNFLRTVDDAIEDLFA